MILSRAAGPVCPIEAVALLVLAGALRAPKPSGVHYGFLLLQVFQNRPDFVGRLTCGHIHIVHRSTGPLEPSLSRPPQLIGPSGGLSEHLGREGFVAWNGERVNSPTTC